MHPDDVRVFSIIDSVRGPSGPDGWDFSARRVGADGRVTWHQSIATPRATRQPCHHISGISLDITRRKETEAGMSASGFPDEPIAGAHGHAV